jgi:hypothetical protein
VTAVNGKPSFQLSTNIISIDENAGIVQIENFATNINDGDPDVKQKLNFSTTITETTGNLTFKSEPQIESSNGDLAFEIDPLRFGTAMISVVLMDDGGTANGGVNVSDKTDFTIIVEIINDPPTIDDISAPITLFEDDGEQVINLTGISPGAGENQSIKITASSGDIELITNIFVEYNDGDQTARLKFSPNSDQFGNTKIEITLDDGQATNNIITKQFSVIVNPVADTPEVTDALLEGVKQTTSGLVISRNPVDGDEVTHFKISNIQKGMLFFHDGMSEIKNNDFITYQEGSEGLKFTVVNGISGSGSFDIQAATGPDDARLGGAVITANIIVDNDAPSIISEPESIVEITKSYNYDVEASDPDANDVLTFTVVFAQKLKNRLKFFYK